jgi:hypothetical protein
MVKEIEKFWKLIKMKAKPPKPMVSSNAVLRESLYYE